MRYWFILAGILFIVGALLCTLTSCDKGSGFEDGRIENTIDIQSDFSSIAINTSRCDIKILSSTGQRYLSTIRWLPYKSHSK